MLLLEALAPVGHALLTDRLRAQVLELLPIEEVQVEVLLVGCELHAGRVAVDDLGVVESVLEVVYQHIVEHARITVFVPHVEVVSRYLVVECALWYVQLRTLLLHGEHQRPELRLGIGAHHVLEVEAHHAYEAYEHHQRTEYLQQRHARRLHGHQLEALSEVSEGDQCCQQHGQRQRGRHQRQSGIDEELCQHRHIEALAHHLIYILPQELHHEDEEADEEGASKQQAETLQYKYVQLLYSEHQFIFYAAKIS